MCKNANEKNVKKITNTTPARAKYNRSLVGSGVPESVLGKELRHRLAAHVALIYSVFPAHGYDALGGSQKKRTKSFSHEQVAPCCSLLIRLSFKRNVGAYFTRMKSADYT